MIILENAYSTIRISSNTLTGVLGVCMTLTMLPFWFHFTLPSIVILFTFPLLKHIRQFLLWAFGPCCWFSLEPLHASSQSNLFVSRSLRVNISSSGKLSLSSRSIPPRQYKCSIGHHTIDATVLTIVYNCLSICLWAPE